MEKSKKTVILCAIYHRQNPSESTEIFEFVWNESISLKETQLILEFSFVIPGTSAAIEKLFSVASVLWT
jgi:hypothetical protein